MALVVEDGTIVENANSYNSLETIKAYALARNRTLPDDDEIISGYAIRAMDYLESFREQYKGELTDPDTPQPLCFPRIDLYIGGASEPFDPNTIPPTMVQAQNQLIVEQSMGVALQPTYVRTDRVKRKKISSLETEWFDGSQTGIDPVISAVDVLIGPLLDTAFGYMKTVRV